MHRRNPGKAPTFAGFLYASAGLAMLLLACEQGERLDWWRSGVIQRIVRRRVVLSAVRAGSEAARSESTGGVALSAEVEHRAAGIPALLLPLHSLHDHHSGAAGAGHPPVLKPNRLDLRSYGVLCHLFLSRLSLHFCCCANLILVSCSPSALPVLPLLLR